MAQDDTRFDEVMPVVTSLAFRTQDEYNKLVELSSDEAEEDSTAADERAFIVGELLKLALQLDYADETGRRKMFQLTSRCTLRRDSVASLEQSNGSPHWFY